MVSTHPNDFVLDSPGSQPRAECFGGLWVLHTHHSAAGENHEDAFLSAEEEYVVDRCGLSLYDNCNSLTSVDKRVKLLQELLGGMKIIKFFAWEAPFLKRIAEYRQQEI